MDSSSHLFAVYVPHPEKTTFGRNIYRVSLPVVRFKSKDFCGEFRLIQRTLREMKYDLIYMVYSNIEETDIPEYPAGVRLIFPFFSPGHSWLRKLSRTRHFFCLIFSFIFAGHYRLRKLPGTRHVLWPNILFLFVGHSRLHNFSRTRHIFWPNILFFYCRPLPAP